VKKVREEWVGGEQIINIRVEVRGYICDVFAPETDFIPGVINVTNRNLPFVIF
jgi:hypothetical protein